MAQFDGKFALVTGASKPTGIGYAIAMRLAKAGASVAVADLCEPLEGFPGYVRTGSNEELNALADQIKALGVRSLAIPLDVTDPASVQAMAARVEDEFGSLDILCNNAGGSPGPQAIRAIEENAWSATIDINLNGVFRVSKAMVPLLLKGEPGGAIVITSSRAAKVPSAFLGAYCSAKAAVNMLTKVLALELSGEGVRVNCICPGQVQTDLGEWGWKLKAMARGQTIEDFMEDMKTEIPLGRPATPDECAKVVEWLASDGAGYITGQAINVTGGQLMEL